MNVLLVMIPLSLVLLAGAAAAFFWAVDHDQFADLDTPGLVPLDDDPSVVPLHASDAAAATTRRTTRACATGSPIGRA
ncbi:MAG TPA: cbb3-type cytochrome oxidase assembly protein CcoS [Gammaproteobacteria bacterium]